MNINKMKTAAFFFCACITFFAVIMLTPLSGIIASGLANQLKSELSYESENENFGTMLLSLSGFSGVSSYSDVSAYLPDDNITDLPEIAVVPESDMRENIQVFNDESIMSIQELYEYYANYDGAKIEEAVPSSLEVPADTYKITPRNFSGQKTIMPKLLMNNETSYNISIDDFLKRDYPINSFDINKQDEPVVLILHTHATESYVEDGATFYSPPFTAERTTDINKNIVLVGTALKNKLEEYNIPVIHTQKMHDAVSYRDSYTRSLETVNEYIIKYPSIKYVIDVHRDSIIADSGEKFKPAVKINGIDTAQVMIVTGTDNGGGVHPDWRDNLSFTAYLQQKMNSKYPMLARPINLRIARFNQHTAKGAIILEVGSCGNTFSEAIRAAELTGECLAELILEHN